MTKPIYLSFVILIIILSGCSGKREINDLAIVMAVGIDKIENPTEGNSEDKGYEVTIEVARPADSRGQTGAPSGGTGDPIWSASSQGETLFEAIRHLASFSTRRVFWAHNYIIVINEDVAREGIKDVIDFFTRNPELRMRTWVAITPNKAKDVISTVTGLEVIPGEALDKLYRYTDISGASPRTELLDVQSAYLSETTQPVIARVRLIERGVSNKKVGQAGAYKQVELEGAGVFKGDKLVGILDRDDSKAAVLFIEKVRSQIVVLSCPKNPEDVLTAEIVHDRFDVTPAYKNGKPSFTVNFKAFVNVVEAGCPFTIEDEEDVRTIEKELERTVKGNIEKLLTKAQKEYKSDFLELGQRFNNKFPSEWKTIKKSWNSTFSDVEFTVNVDAKVKGGVLLYSPTRSGK
ncbi:Ger(x)C family spore germination protein [Schinkia azotoformans]|uniref:Ger(X)C family germination protein n=1 Tax=Schinkia azotoformans LMG 9581 TaxID=1131731 RepID=K6D467_SCHAZ|nr:Ger(x)C family spore germination protein [Schinkia azotoformans]EKN63054.1 Ger(x)C family germination protein [Schinkia azotoformans LMG 9581]MEC1639116.1 Ger(x)C family spore germination protein [Schinkia azotoformans]MEC1722313.1 Ger(x)C family spore germination protein [Schinkia azotoformans]MEC1945145.1 Ger(x)C family spore germination protein [Schinkia azotoformans]MED4354672.1 Ger(x)C family spore germination protein [Schinkia azotoformans]